MRSKGILCITIFSYNLLTEAESPVSEKLERSNNVEYNKTLKYETDLSPKAAPSECGNYHLKSFSNKIALDKTHKM
ncbi:hypothetical protein FF021_19490 [Leptospira noguchii]|uniref:Uncharacterized protein n=1 Tax=Leptospira noguchii serovar Autumnalis str. ZUN142 TaxID=1085540 RepID=M6UPV0_9LEPT|nr:hypothetical protein LEP1GSC186_2560 [Leptospira noguchii serovar Autumnalis str. ZUN142]TQE65099.1 hypothetical protein FF021_19490 [Leptospira noguchii]